MFTNSKGGGGMKKIEIVNLYPGEKPPPEKEVIDDSKFKGG